MLINKLVLFSFVHYAAFVFASPAVTTTTSATPPLRTLAANHGIYIGAALSSGFLTTAQYASVAGTQFGSVTARTEMTWAATEPTQNTFTYTAGDKIVSFALSHNQNVRGQTLVWGSSVPSWVSTIAPTALNAAMQNHIVNVASHWKGRVAAWDVVKEIFNDDGTFKVNDFYNALGTAYVSNALTYARAADPNAKLYISDYNVEGVTAKSTALLNLATLLKSKNILDGVGFEGRIATGQLLGTFVPNINRFSAIGLQVAVTEFLDSVPLPATAAETVAHAHDYTEVFGYCLVATGCVGVTLWGFTDADPGGTGTYLLPWNVNYQTTLSYQGVVVALP